MKLESGESNSRSTTEARGTGTFVPNAGRTPVVDMLRSWKEIAAFLECDQRTAMRWAKDRGMPVHRVPGGKRSGVSGSRAEITHWLAGVDTSQSLRGEVASVTARRPLWIRYAVVAAAVCGLGLIPAGIVLSRRSRPAIPNRVTFTGETVVTLDSADRPLWEHDFHRKIDARGGNLTEFARIADLKGDGEQEVLVAAPLCTGPNPQDPFESEVDCFSGQGRLLWSYKPHETLRFGNSELRGPWWVRDVLVSHQGQKHSVWVAFTHAEWGNTFVVEIDPATGQGTTRYVNTGTVYALNEMRTSRTTYLLAGGFNNEYDGGSLALIDKSKPFAASPQTDGTRHKCRNCPPGLPDYYLVFPRSEINQAERKYENPLLAGIHIDGDLVEVSKQETSDLAARSIYMVRFGFAVQPISLRYSSTYDMLHRAMEKDGTLQHSLAACPERLHPAPIRMWTPSEGWQELAIPPTARPN